jgi:hypothetical protein
MIDWFWSNMEKGFVLWHPEQHEPMEWPVPPVHGQPLGAIHNAPQTWDDGRRQNLYIRFERLEDVKPEVRDVIVHLRRNPFTDLRVEGRGRDARYVHVA